MNLLQRLWPVPKTVLADLLENPYYVAKLSSTTFLGMFYELFSLLDRCESIDVVP
jgi:predicted metallopeptidase